MKSPYRFTGLNKAKPFSWSACETGARGGEIRRAMGRTVKRYGSG